MARSLLATQFEESFNKLISCQEFKSSLSMLNLSDVTFYTDSFNDLPLLSKAGKAIVVDGDDKLTLLAKKNDWECISFR